MDSNMHTDATGLYEEMAGNVKTPPKSVSLEGNRKELANYLEFAGAVSKEISSVLIKVNEEEVLQLIKEITAAEKIFFIGVGRVFLAHQCIAKRLAHFGFDVNIVGSVVEKPISDKDLLIVASGSGESELPLSITKIAKKHKVRIAIITSSKQSSIKSLADIAVHLPTPTKTDMTYGIQTIQPMSTLFDQALHIFGDILCLLLQQHTGQSNEELKKRHANLE